MPRPLLRWLFVGSVLLFLGTLVVRFYLPPEPQIPKKPPTEDFRLPTLPSSLSLPASAPSLESVSEEDFSLLVRLVKEMLSPTPKAAPKRALRLYSYAFAGYALASVGRASPTFSKEAEALLDSLIAQVLKESWVSLFGTGERTILEQKFSASVVLRGHLSLLLLGRESLGPLSQEQERFLTALVQGLAEDFLKDENHLLPSYGTTTYPADNEIAASALSLYLAHHEDPLVQRALEALSTSLTALEVEGLPPSKISGETLFGSDVPRGCALSWTVAFRAYRDKESARALYQRYRAAYWVSAGPVVGFREWPVGVERPSDTDSGPIVFGIGTAASAIGMSAARLTEHEEDYQKLFRAASLAGLGAIEAKEAGDWLERAIAIYAKVARLW